MATVTVPPDVSPWDAPLTPSYPPALSPGTKRATGRAETGGAAAMVVRRGDATSGTVLVKVSTLDGEAEVFSPARDGDGAARLGCARFEAPPHQAGDGCRFR